MQNRLVITIADEKGARQFQVHKHIKKIVVWVLILFICFIGGIILLMKFLMHTMDTIALGQNIAISEYRYIYQQNEILKHKIQQKNNELNMIHQKIGDLESIIGTQKNNQKIYDKMKEIDLEQLAYQHKEMILNLIPSGAPILLQAKRQNASPKEYTNRKKEALGVNFDVPRHTPVYATSDGVVDTLRSNYKKGYGNFIKINHSFGFSSLYAHLDEVLLKKGEFVRKGELIGYSGSSGSVKSPVLYYEVLFLNKILNTELYVQWNMENFNSLLLNNNTIDWESLVWTIQDVLKLKNFQNKK